MDNTPLLSLPLLAHKQALQTTFHDDAIRTLDALVMLAVIDRDLSSPPPLPSEGDRYIVKAPGSGDDAWQDDNVVVFADGHWKPLPPRLGWTCYVADEGALIAWDGTAWQPALDVLGGGAAQNLALLGVGTEADAVNPFSAKLNNALWTAKTVAEGGDGDLRYKMSKESAAKTLSILLQDDFSGRAEIGLTGDDDFHFKVSADGSDWVDALVIDHATGGARFLAHETSAASAATCDIGAAASLKVSITGTTAITSFGTQPHRLAIVRFTDTLTLTHHATSLILPGAENISTAGGDTAVFASDDSGNWRCWSYQRADGTAIAAPAVSAAAQQVDVLTPHERLIVKWVTTSTVDIDANAVVLFDGASNSKRFASLDETLNITTGGANGLDTGSEGSSRWYHIWAIGKDDGTLDGLLSESSSSPTLPAGYAYKGYLGAVYNNGSSNFVTFYQRSRFVICVSTSALAAGTQTSYTAIDLSALVPPTATFVGGAQTIATTSGTAAITGSLAPAGSGTTPTYGGACNMVASVSTAGVQQPGRVMIATPQQVVYFVSGANGTLDFAVRGWEY